MSKNEPLIVALDVERTVARSGTMSRVHYALQNHPAGLTLEEICDICHLTPSNVSIHGLRNLFHFQLAEKAEGGGEDIVYRLKTTDISVASPEAERSRSPEDVRRR